jgi:enoyl-CoA hydratase/carnithine racemase
MANLDDYASRYSAFATMTRQGGVLTVSFHTAGGAWVLSGAARDLLPRLFFDIAQDRDNRVIILAGSGDAFCAELDAQGLASELGHFGPDTTDLWRFEGNNAARKLLEIEAPIILCLNGPLLQHAEIWMAADIVLAAPQAVVQDMHMPGGLPPGGDAQAVWESLLGHSRAKYFLLTGQRLSAAALHGLGVVHELVERPALLARAHELAERFCGLNRHVLRYAKAAVTERLRRHLALEQPYTQALVMLGATTAVPELLAAQSAHRS